MRDFLKSAFSRLYQIEAEMALLYEKAANGDMGCLGRAAQLQECLEMEDFYSIDTRIEQVASGLGLFAVGLDRTIDQMSGGQRAKVILAKLLLEKPDVLLLDEPTNFLDKEHVAWLADYLSELENAFMVVSHDFAFLDKIANRICDIDNYQIAKYYGTYSEFLKKKTLLREDYVRQYSAQQREIKKTEEFIRKNIAGRKSKMARGRQKQLDRMDKLEALDQKEIKPIFYFPVLPRTNTEHLLVSNLAVGYYYPVLSDISFAIKGGQKIIITGFNGIGKSTLLKSLIGQLPALHGQFKFSAQVTFGYFEQDLVWADSNRTPVEILSDAHPDMVMKEIRKHLAQCGISSKHAMQPIGSLSGGEQAKVKMCLLSLMKYSMLKTFGSKYRCQVRKIKERYVKNGEFTVPYTTKAGPKEAIYYHSGFRKQDKPQLGQVDILDIYKKYSKPNSLATRLRSKQCELCGAECGGLVIHQVKRLKDLTGQYEWEILMRKRHRKTLAVSPSCHAEIHNSMKS